MVNAQRTRMYLEIAQKTGLPFGEIEKVVDAQFRLAKRSMEERKKFVIRFVGTLRPNRKAIKYFERYLDRIESEE
jgi:hypothetical protein